VAVEVARVPPVLASLMWPASRPVEPAELVAQAAQVELVEVAEAAPDRTSCGTTAC
jgi:hypothetical protein